MTTVLVGAFPPMIDRGIASVLADEGLDPVRAPSGVTPDAVRRARPCEVVVDLDDAAADSAARRLVVEFPGLPIVECSSSEPRLRVFPAYQFGESYESALTIPRLVEAIAGP